jgi:hypothetical protein
MFKLIAPPRDGLAEPLEGVQEFSKMNIDTSARRLSVFGFRLHMPLPRQKLSRPPGERASS